MSMQAWGESYKVRLDENRTIQAEEIEGKLDNNPGDHESIRKRQCLFYGRQESFVRLPEGIKLQKGN
ncbi:hypothetical protein D3C71_1810960 [compost metagenome]